MIKYRKYKNYNEYIYHQSKKINFVIQNEDGRILDFDKNIEIFKKRIIKFKNFINEKDKIICLGARLGQEVIAFKKLGYNDTIGIDINSGKSLFVIDCDFNNTIFRDNVFDVAYCNCIDHCYNIKLFESEVVRILKPKGKLLLEIPDGNRFNDRTFASTKYESTMWNNYKDIVRELRKFKFILTIDKIDKFLLCVLQNEK